MPFDWETFAKQGLNPAMSFLQDYYGMGLRSGLSRQEHLQTMKEMETRYGLQRGQTGYEGQEKERLMRIEQDIERSLTLDKEYLHLHRIDYTNNLEMAKQREGLQGQMAIANIYHQSGIARANIYKEIALINNSMTESLKFNPDAAPQINQNSWQNLNEDFDFLTDAMQEMETRKNDIQGNPFFQKIDQARRLGPEEEQKLMDEFGVGYNEEMDWYKEKIDQLNELEKQSRLKRKMLSSTRNELVKFSIGTKIVGGPPPEEAMQTLMKLGIPIPQTQPDPMTPRDMGEHILFIQKLVENGMDLPSSFALTQNGLDANWLTQNWPTYRTFMKQRGEQILESMRDGYGKIHKNSKEIGKNLARIMF